MTKSIMTKETANLRKMEKYRQWSSEKAVVPPRTVKGVLSGDKDTIVSQDCTADPCNCTGCSEWD